MTAAKKGPGGARPGAGRKPNEPERLHVEPTDDPIEFLRRVMKDPLADAKTRMAAASKLASLQVSGGNKGKKEQVQQVADNAAAPGSRFAPAAPPKLRAVG